MAVVMGWLLLFPVESKSADVRFDVTANGAHGESCLESTRDDPQARGQSGGQIAFEFGMAVDGGSSRVIVSGEQRIGPGEHTFASVMPSARLLISGGRVVIRCEGRFTPQAIKWEPQALEEAVEPPDLTLFLGGTFDPVGGSATVKVDLGFPHDPSDDPDELFANKQPAPGGKFRLVTARTNVFPGTLRANGGDGACGKPGGRGGQITVSAPPDLELKALEVLALGGSGGWGVGPGTGFGDWGGGGGDGGAICLAVNRGSGRLDASGGHGGRGYDGEPGEDGGSGGPGGIGGMIRLAKTPTALFEFGAWGGNGGDGGNGAHARSGRGGHGGNGGDGGICGAVTALPEGHGQAFPRSMPGSGGKGGRGGDGSDDLTFDPTVPPQPGAGGNGGNGGATGAFSPDNPLPFERTITLLGMTVTLRQGFPGSPGKAGKGGVGKYWELLSPPLPDVAAPNGQEGNLGRSGRILASSELELALTREVEVKGWPECGAAFPDRMLAEGVNGKVLVRCVSDAAALPNHFEVAWKDPRGNETAIGLCRYEEGKNSLILYRNRCDDSILKVIWVNEEGWDDAGNRIVTDLLGIDSTRYEIDEYHFLPGTGMLTVTKALVGITVSIGGVRTLAPTTVADSLPLFPSDVAPRTHCELRARTGWPCSAGSRSSSNNPRTETIVLTGVSQPGALTVELVGRSQIFQLRGGETSREVADHIEQWIRQTPTLEESGVTVDRKHDVAGGSDRLTIVNVPSGELRISSVGQDQLGLMVLNQGEPARLSITDAGGYYELHWTSLIEGVSIETTPQIGLGAQWKPLPQSATEESAPGRRTLRLDKSSLLRFYRLRLLQSPGP